MSDDLTLPRLLCLHGAGVNAAIFQLQCRAIIAKLGDRFRFVFADGFLEEDADENVKAVFGEFAPFKRWVAWRNYHEPLDPVATSKSIVKQITDAMEEDPGTGEWVGMIGFSQGGVIASSLLWAQDHIADESKRPLPGVNFRFAVLMAAPGPVLLIDPSGTITGPRHVGSAGDVMLQYRDFPEDDNEDEAHKVLTPTLHVHGLQDPALENHRRLYKYCKKETAMLLEWDGDHRVPIKPRDVAQVVNRIVKLADKTGVVLP
ncbi:serine hydrolase FSH [Trichoderma chlorosporum]